MLKFINQSEVLNDSTVMLYELCCHLQAAGEVNPMLFTIATLTGHVIRAFGPNYSVS